MAAKAITDLKKSAKATADVNQAAVNVNLGVKAITDVKKSAKATADVKPLTRSVD